MGLQDRALTEEMFASLREHGVSPDKPLLWGYFFYGEAVPLHKVWESLKNDGYNLVRLEKTDDNSTFILHIEKVEMHTVDSLLERSRDLAEIAWPLGADYDGMDVGPPENR